MRILFLSPHTDDVELGAGGSLIKLIEDSHEIFWVVFSAPSVSLKGNLPDNTLKQEFIKVVKTLNIPKSHYKIYKFRVRRLHEHRQEILEELIDIRKEIDPELVVGPSLHDHHQDHQVVANEMIRAFKNSSSIISYELPWNHIKFDAQLFVKLEERHVDRKIELLQNYKSQIMMNRPYFKEDYIRGWARMRGVQIGSDFAESYEVIRWIIP